MFIKTEYILVLNSWKDLLLYAGILHSILWVLLDYNESNICTCNTSLWKIMMGYSYIKGRIAIMH